MKSVLIYTTKSGATETCARLIAEQLNDCVLVDIDKQEVNLSEYDKVILGSGIRVGKVYKSMRSFMKKSLNALLEKPVWIYFCSIDVEGFAGAVEKSVPAELRESAKAIVSLGGKPPFKAETPTEEWLKEDVLNNLVQEVIKG